MKKLNIFITLALFVCALPAAWAMDSCERIIEIGGDDSFQDPNSWPAKEMSDHELSRRIKREAKVNELHTAAFAAGPGIMPMSIGKAQYYHSSLLKFSDPNPYDIANNGKRAVCLRVAKKLVESEIGKQKLINTYFRYILNMSYHPGATLGAEGIASISRHMWVLHQVVPDIDANLEAQLVRSDLTRQQRNNLAHALAETMVYTGRISRSIELALLNPYTEVQKIILQRILSLALSTVDDHREAVIYAMPILLGLRYDHQAQGVQKVLEDIFDAVPKITVIQVPVLLNLLDRGVTDTALDRIGVYLSHPDAYGEWLLDELFRRAFFQPKRKPDLKVRDMAIRTLGKMGSKILEVRPAVRDRLMDLIFQQDFLEVDEHVMRLAVSALLNLGVQNKEVERALLSCAQSQELTVSGPALQTLSELEVISDEAIDVFIQKLRYLGKVSYKASYEEIQFSSIIYAGLKKRTRRSIQKLIEVYGKLQARNEKINILEALMVLGHSSREALHIVEVVALEDSDERIVQAAMDTIVQYKPEHIKGLIRKKGKASQSRSQKAWSKSLDKQRARAERILKKISEIEEDLAGYSLEDFLANRVLRKAVRMDFFDIGEIIQYLPVEIGDLKELRNISGHQEASVDFKNLYQMAHDRLPALKEMIETYLQTLG